MWTQYIVRNVNKQVRNYTLSNIKFQISHRSNIAFYLLVPRAEEPHALIIFLINFIGSCDIICATMQQINLLKPIGHVMYQQFNIQQLYALPTLYLFVLYLSENKQRLVPLTA
jgi:hypothetical protein